MNQIKQALGKAGFGVEEDQEFISAQNSAGFHNTFILKASRANSIKAAVLSTGDVASAAKILPGDWTESGWLLHQLSPAPAGTC